MVGIYSYIATSLLDSTPTTQVPAQNHATALRRTPLGRAGKARFCSTSCRRGLRLWWLPKSYQYICLGPRDPRTLRPLQGIVPNITSARGVLVTPCQYCRGSAFQSTAFQIAGLRGQVPLGNRCARDWSKLKLSACSRQGPEKGRDWSIAFIQELLAGYQHSPPILHEGSISVDQRNLETFRAPQPSLAPKALLLIGLNPGAGPHCVNISRGNPPLLP